MLWLAIANLISQSYAIFLNKKLSFGSLASFLQINLPRNLLEEKFLRVSYYIRIFAFLRNVTGKCLYNTTISRINRVSLVVSLGFRAQATRVSYKPVSYKKRVFQVIPGYSGLFQVIPGYSRLFQVIPGYSRLFQLIPGYSRLFQVILGYSRLFQVIPGYSRLFQVIPCFTTSPVRRRPSLDDGK